MKRLLFFSTCLTSVLFLASCGPKPHGKNAGPVENSLSKMGKEMMAKPTKSWRLQSQSCENSGDSVSSSAKANSGLQVHFELQLTEGAAGGGGRVSEIYSAGDDCVLTVNGGYALVGSELHLTIVSIEGAALAKKTCGLVFNGSPGDIAKYAFQATAKELVLSQADTQKSCKTGEKIVSRFTP